MFFLRHSRCFRSKDSRLSRLYSRNFSGSLLRRWASRFLARSELRAYHSLARRLLRSTFSALDMNAEYQRFCRSLFFSLQILTRITAFFRLSSEVDTRKMLL